MLKNIKRIILIDLMGDLNKESDVKQVSLFNKSN